jgi:restriction endonuclease S subunit
LMTGKVLGQFFTPPSVKHMMVKLIAPQLRSDGTFETIFDPAMGTGGFLITAFKHLYEQSKEKSIPINWEFVGTDGLGGREVEKDTFQLAVNNMIISTGHAGNSLEEGDSIRDPITKKVDIVLANMPFGIKGLNYDDIGNGSGKKDEYIPIKTSSSVPLFLQAIVYMLKVGGRCAVVMPDGQDLFNKGSALVAVREYLMKTCDLKEVIYLPSGIFTHTSIKTCVFYFVKKREGTDVIKVNTKISSRSYTFSKTLQTTSVKFYDYNPYEDVKNLLIDVPIEKIAGNGFSLNYAEYLVSEIQEEVPEGVVMKSLGEVCEFKNGTNITKDKLIHGIYPVVGGGKTPLGFHNAYTVDEYSIIISKDGAYAGYVSMYPTKLFISNHGIYISNINETIVIKNYIYYYLKIILQEKLYSLQTGTAQPGVNKEKISQLKISVPSLEKQREIVEYLDFIYEKANKTSLEKISELKQLNAFCLKNQKKFPVKTLGEVCDIEYGTRIVKAHNEEGQYSVYGSGRAMFSTTTFNRDGFTILIGRFALSKECVRFINEKIFLNDSGLSVKPVADNILHKYIGYYLFSNQNVIYSCARGTAQKNLDISEFKSIKIPIPSLEKQREIVEYCEFNDSLILQLEREIEQNKKCAAEFLANAISSVDVEEEDEEEQVISAGGGGAIEEEEEEEEKEVSAGGGGDIEEEEEEEIKDPPKKVKIIKIKSK